MKGLDWLLVGLGGGVGSVLRYVVARAVQERTAVTWPYGTLGVNVVGCFVIGVLLALAARNRLGAEWQLLLATGVCGGFTTFSTFSWEALALLRAGQAGPALLYIGASLALGLAATAGGVWLGRWL